jgi:serine/threonine protein kinase
MKGKYAEASVAGVCTLLERSRLLSAAEVEALRQRWQSEARDPASLEAFAPWLVANRYATEFHVSLLLRGYTDHFFLGPYKLLERVGKGRLTTVYKAVHRLGHVVAVKVLPPSQARDPQALARFRREATVALRLQHPNVVRSLEAGTDDGVHYLVMEYLEGETLQQRLDRRGRLPPAEATDLIRQALLGLQHLHEQGLVHRSLEPANLMLVRAEGEGELAAPVVKILDISFSLLTDEVLPAGERPGRLTQEGVLLGVPAYLAPEQARDAHAADVRADVYSLGCILYHALAGRPPYEDASPQRQLIRHATETPRPLPELVPEVPGGLDQVVHWMMARDPAARYQTPERAALALQAFLDWIAAGAESPFIPLPPDLSALDLAPPPLPAVPVPAEDTPWPGAADLDFEADLGEHVRHPHPVRRAERGRAGLLLLLGAASMLLAQALGWGLGRLAFRPAPPASAAPQAGGGR